MLHILAFLPLHHSLDKTVFQISIRLKKRQRSSWIKNFFFFFPLMSLCKKLITIYQLFLQGISYECFPVLKGKVYLALISITWNEISSQITAERTTMNCFLISGESLCQLSLKQVSMCLHYSTSWVDKQLFHLQIRCCI